MTSTTSVPIPSNGTIRIQMARVDDAEAKINNSHAVNKIQLVT